MIDRNVDYKEVDDLITKYESRPAKYAGAEYDRRLRDIENGRAISVLTGGPPNVPDDRSIALLASGRVSHSEYQKLGLKLVFAWRGRH